MYLIIIVIYTSSWSYQVWKEVDMLKYVLIQESKKSINHVYMCWRVDVLDHLF